MYECEPGTIGAAILSYFRIMDFSLPRPFAPGSETSRCGTFAPWNFLSLVLSKRMEDGANAPTSE